MRARARARHHTQQFKPGHLQNKKSVAHSEDPILSMAHTSLYIQHSRVFKPDTRERIRWFRLCLLKNQLIETADTIIL
jgi:hypothetical protein